MRDHLAMDVLSGLYREYTPICDYVVLARIHLRYIEDCTFSEDMLEMIDGLGLNFRPIRLNKPHYLGMR